MLYILYLILYSSPVLSSVPFSSYFTIYLPSLPFFPSSQSSNPLFSSHPFPSPHSKYTCRCLLLDTYISSFILLSPLIPFLIPSSPLLLFFPSSLPPNPLLFFSFLPSQPFYTCRDLHILIYIQSFQSSLLILILVSQSSILLLLFLSSLLLSSSIPSPLLSSVLLFLSPSNHPHLIYLPSFPTLVHPDLSVNSKYTCRH